MFENIGGPATEFMVTPELHNEEDRRFYAAKDQMTDQLLLVTGARSTSSFRKALREASDPQDVFFRALEALPFKPESPEINGIMSAVLDMSGHLYQLTGLSAVVWFVRMNCEPLDG